MRKYIGKLGGSARCAFGLVFFSILITSLPVAAGTSLLMDVPELVLTRSDDGATVLSARFPVLQTTDDPSAVDGVAWNRPPTLFDDGENPQREIPVSARAVIALPTRETPRLRVTSWTWLREPDRTVDVAGQIELGRLHVLRGVPTISVRVRPETLGGGVLSEVVFSVSHQPTSAYRRALASTPDDKQFTGPVPAQRSVINEDLYRRLHDGLARENTNAVRAHTKSARLSQSDNWLKLEVDATGAVTLTATKMALAGVDLEDVDPADLRLFRALQRELPENPEVAGSWGEDWDGLEEVAISISSAMTWTTGDEVRFYGVGPNAWLDRMDPDADPLDHVEHLYANTAVYWLTWEDFETESPFAGDPLRIVTDSAAPHGLTAETTHRRRLHLEESNVEAYGRLHDQWSWTSSLVNEKIIDFEDATAVAGGEVFFVVDVRAYLYSGVGSQPHRALVWINQDQANAAEREWLRTEEDDSLRIRATGTSTALKSGLNSMTIRNDGSSTGPNLILDSIDLLYPAELRKTAGSLSFVHWGEGIVAADTQVDLRIAGAAGAAVVWDVSDPLAPVAMTGSVSGDDLVLGLTRQPGVNRHFLVATTANLIGPVKREMRRPDALRSLDRDLDYLIISAPEFMDAATTLGAFRADNLPGVADPSVAVVDASEIYDAFGGGVRDPLALRNFLKWVWLGSDGRFEQVCFLGDASRDYRNYRNIFPDLLPTWVRLFFPVSMIGYGAATYASDDFLASFDNDGTLYYNDVPDLACGRLTVRTVEEARLRVEQIIAYEADPVSGDWSNRVVMATDDLAQPSNPDDFEYMHTGQGENLVNNYVPESLDVHKVYLLDYEKPAGVSYKPAARQQAREEWNDGLTMFHYIGHGADNTLADEQLFLTDDIYGLANGMRRGVFLAFSCDVGIYDQITKQSMAETFVAQQNGGAIASIAAAQVSYVNQNDLLSDYFYSSLFPGRTVDPSVSLGDALWNAKILIGDYNYDFDLSNALRYLLHCDPALRLPHPLGDVEFHAASTDSLRGGRREEVVVVLPEQGIAASELKSYSLLVQEAREDKSATNGVRVLRWWRPGAVTFRGEGVSSTDTLRVPFMVPLQLRYGDHGKIRLLLDTDQGQRTATIDLPVVQASTGAVTDVDGPAISLAFEDDRYRVKVGTLLNSVMSDTSGISILGTNPLNSLLLEFDGDGRMTNVSDAFTFDANSFTTGRLSVALPSDLAMGDHTATLYASDVLGNVGSDTLSFRMVAGDVARIDDVTVFPNPTPGPTRLLFELSDPMAVEWTLYTLAGHRIAGLREEYSSAGPQILHWDGRDDRGDELANGVYLYVLRGSWAGDPDHDIVVTGQMVMMK